MRVPVILLSLLLTATNSLAAWQVTTNKDSMTDEIKQSATVINEDGHLLSVYRHPNGSVWVNFSLASRSLDQLAPQQPPLFRIDKNVPQKVYQERGHGSQIFAWEPKSVTFIIWHGKEVEGRSETLNQLMQGTSLVFRYYLFTGGYKETTFSLSGAGPAIAEALGIPLNADPTVSANAKAFRKEVLAASKACDQLAAGIGNVIDRRNSFLACMERLKLCATQANYDPEKFRQCLK